MRKIFVTLSIIWISLIASNPALASRARVAVFDTGDGGALLGAGASMGSFQTDDMYNIFYNPAYLNDYNDFVTIEKSNAYGYETVTSTGTTSAASALTAQGGFISNWGLFTLGLFFNRIEAINQIRSPTTTLTNDYSNKGQMAPLELLFGMETKGVKWGLDLSYASVNPVNKARKDYDMNLRVGASYMGFDPWLHYKIMGNDDIQGSNATKHTDYGGGMKYTWGEWTPYGGYSYYEINPDGDNNDINLHSWGLGLSRNQRVTQGVQLGYSAGYWVSNRPVVRSGGTGYQLMVPISVFAEGDALSWLTLRAGITYFAVDTNGGASANSDRTKGRFGATIRVSKIDLDWVIGNNAAATTVSTEQAAMDAAAFDISNRFFTAASLTYKW